MGKIAIAGAAVFAVIFVISWWLSKNKRMTKKTEGR